MTAGTALTLWSARAAFLLYACALAGWLSGKPRAARLAWTCGFVVYLSHVAAAFQFHHHWSHAAAYAETARQTAELAGVRWGWGIYLNYLFTLVWACDAIWIWWSPQTHRWRPRWISAAIHSFMAFLFFNATVVFVSGPVRWLGLTVTAALGIQWLYGRRATPNVS
jgi:hypothetical protein